jgi:hydrophobic/amphiphilic exporter-1 (mainly G- bacteria), HAE1 family
MKISEICVKKPVFTVMLIASTAVLGIFSYLKLGVDLYPDIEFPFVAIQTTLPGASPEEIETSITKPIEEAVNTISGIEDINSTSYEGLSFIIIKFVLEKDENVAAQDVRDKVDSIGKDLPEGTDPPVVLKFDIGASPIMNIAVSGNTDLISLTRVARKKIKENIETVSGVGSVDIVGGREREIHISINPLKLSALGLSIKDVKDALIEQNIEIPGGKVEQKGTEYGLRILGRIGNVEDFKNVVIATKNGYSVKISDVGTVEDTGERITTKSILNGKPSITLIVQKQSGTNTIEVVDKLKKRLTQIGPALPKGITLRIMGDQSSFIKDSVAAVREDLMLGALLASVMVLIFMGSLRPTVISTLAIPCSIVATFTFMLMAGFTLNKMTLLGLTVAVGIVIDDAIVVLENIYRHIHKLGKSAFQAAIEGTREVGFAVLATTLSLLVIFIPLAYMHGIVGRFIKSYGLTVAFAIAVSIFISFTLTPMLCSIFLKNTGDKKTKLSTFTDSINHFLSERYAKILNWSLFHRKTMVAISVALMLSMVPLLIFVGKDFLPKSDTSKAQINITAPEGTDVAGMEDIFKQITTEVKQLPHLENTLVSVGRNDQGATQSNQGNILLEFSDVDKRSVSLFEIVDKIREIMSKYKGLRFSVGFVGGFEGGSEFDLDYVITGPDLQQLQKYANAIADKLKHEKGFVDVDTSFSFAKPEYRVKIDRRRAHDLGVKIQDIATTLRTIVGGEEDITKYKEGDDLYQVRLRADKNYRNSKEAISALMIHADGGKLVRLDNVATVVEGYGPTQISRYNRQREITVLANLDGIPMGDAIKRADDIFKSLNPDPEYSGNLVGKAKELGNMLKEFLMAFILSILFVYMILASQFESFVYPLSIMVCLPLTLPFALLSLFLVGQNLTIFSIMGLFILIGIVKKNSILQVDYTNILRGRGMERTPAILEACKTRLRPILMTTFTLIAGMLPAAFATGASSADRKAMAWVIVGGQSLSLLITLLMTPVVYSLLDDLQNWFRRKYKGNKNPEQTPT